MHESKFFTNDIAAQARIERLMQLYKALSEVNQAIVRVRDESDLFPLVCRVAVDMGGMRMSWIGQQNETGDLIKSVASYGSGAEYLNGIVISTKEDMPEGRGPFAIAFRENRNVVLTDFQTNEITAPWHARAYKYGWKSGGFFPITRAGKPIAVLAVYHQNAQAFDQETVTLFGEMVCDISFALDNFDREKQRSEAVQALYQSEQHFRAYFERSMVGMAATSPETGWLEVNDAMCAMLGYSREELLCLNWSDLTHPDDLPANLILLDRLRSGESDEHTIDNRFLRKDGSIIHTHRAARAVRKADGSLDYVIALVEDITARKQMENHERLRNRALELLAKGAPLADILNTVVSGVEADDPTMICSILVLDDLGKYLMTGAAPSLPDYFNTAMNGIEIGPGAASCGTTVYTGSRVIVEDIQTHPYWKSFKELAAKAGLVSSWSQAIRSASGKVLGTFSIYHRTKCAPTDSDIELIENAANLAGIAIDRKHFEDEQQLASLVYQNSAEAMMIADAKNRIIAINPAFSQVTGYNFEEVRGKNAKILSSGRHNEAFYQEMWHSINTSGYWQGEIWDQRKNGEVFPEWLTINAIRNKDGSVYRYVAISSDISERKQNEELIWKQANYDSLTDLPNRRMFRERLEQEIKTAHRADFLLALLFIDLDLFKEVNDTLGHDIGDMLLKAAARRINECVRESDTVARLGGDEFMVILSQLPDTSPIENIAQNIIQKLSEPYILGSEIVYVSASLGITIYPFDAEEAEQLVRNADQAMYVAKYEGRNRFSYFTHSLQEAAQTRLKLIKDLRVALAANQFRVFFQPILDLSTGCIHKAEALLRWEHPQRGMISPMEFIPLAEETGLIIEIGNWVFRESALWAKRWAVQGREDFQVSVNVSPVQFRDEGNHIDTWLTYLQTLELSGKNIVVEITEGLLLHADSGVIDKLLKFRDADIQVAIDDFGTGYSSLSYLKKFHIDYLKIDQSFIHNLETDPSDMALSEAIIVMAHKLGLQVIAEGVETAGHRQLLAAAGCDYAQGYLFSMPVPPEELETLLHSGFA
ncbi:EAL domain-containing protein [Sulfuriferula multivorans]|nr:EAL domain-containing protein [Sulfuriferula multivorans]